MHDLDFNPTVDRQAEDRLTRVQARKVATDPDNAGKSNDEMASAVAKTVKERLLTVVEDIDFGVRSPMFEFTIITDGDEDASYAKIQKAATYVFN